MPPTFANGKICYIEMPATDVARSSNFYKQVFGWNIRKRDDGSTSFDDTVGDLRACGRRAEIHDCQCGNKHKPKSHGVSPRSMRGP